MDCMTLIIVILMIVLGITLIKYRKLHNTNKQIRKELEKTRNVYNDVLYDNCILAGKIEKIKNLNLIDYTNNNYYRELLTTEQQMGII